MQGLPKLRQHGSYHDPIRACRVNGACFEPSQLVHSALGSSCAQTRRMWPSCTSVSRSATGPGATTHSAELGHPAGNGESVLFSSCKRSTPGHYIIPITPSYLPAGTKPSRHPSPYHHHRPHHLQHCHQLPPSCPTPTAGRTPWNLVFLQPLSAIQTGTRTRTRP